MPRVWYDRVVMKDHNEKTKPQRTGGLFWGIITLAWSIIVYILYFINLVKNYLSDN